MTEVKTKQMKRKEKKTRRDGWGAKERRRISRGSQRRRLVSDSVTHRRVLREDDYANRFLDKISYPLKRILNIFESPPHEYKTKVNGISVFYEWQKKKNPSLISGKVFCAH